jgi:hypothetical protein
MGVVHQSKHIRSTRKVAEVNIGKLHERGVSCKAHGRQNKQEDTDVQRPRLRPFGASPADEQNTLDEDGKQDSWEGAVRRPFGS